MISSAVIAKQRTVRLIARCILLRLAVFLAQLRAKQLNELKNTLICRLEN